MVSDAQLDDKRRKTTRTCIFGPPILSLPETFSDRAPPRKETEPMYKKKKLAMRKHRARQIRLKAKMKAMKTKGASK